MPSANQQQIQATLLNFPSQDAISWGGNDDPKGLLEVGQTYDVAQIEIRSSHTKLHLVGFPGKVFNSVSFKIMPEDAWEKAAEAWRKNLTD
jgi:hypothetical protein